MSHSRSIWMVVAFTAGFLSVGVPYWRLPYDQVNLPGSLYSLALVVVAAGAAVVRVQAGASWMRSTLVAGLAVPAVVMVRVARETAVDPTSHNLWPFEVVLALMVGLGAALPGSVVGSALRGFGVRVQRTGAR